jgi:hypothetical protein
MAGLSKEVVIGLSVVGAAAALGIAYVVANKNNATAAAALLQSQTQSAMGGSGTVASSLVNGVSYTINATAPAGTPDASGLAAALNTMGWTGANVTAFTMAGAPYTAIATWGGANGAAVPAGATVTVT